MPVFKLDIEKLRQGEYWSNRYFVNAPTIEDARNSAGAVVLAERNFTSELVTFTKMVISDLAENTDVFLSVPLNLLGNKPTSGELMPLWNIVRVALSAGVGRQPFKQYRGVLGEGDVFFDTIVGNVADLIDQQLTDVLIALPGYLCDRLGNPITLASAARRPFSRQLRRGTKRRQNPILP